MITTNISSTIPSRHFKEGDVITTDADMLQYIFEETYGNMISEGKVVTNSSEGKRGYIFFLLSGVFLMFLAIYIMIPSDAELATLSYGFIILSRLFGPGIIMILMSFIFIFVGYKGLRQSHFYTYLKKYQDMKQNFLEKLSSVESMVRSDISDSSLDPEKLESISLLARILSELPRYLEGCILYMRTHSENFTYSSTEGVINQYLARESMGMQNMFHYTEGLLRGWMENHLSELEGEKTRIHYEIDSLKSLPREYNAVLVLAEKGLATHIESAGNILIKG